MTRKIISLLGLTLFLSGCSTIVSGTQQSVFIDTPFVEDAKCTLKDSKNGSWYLPATPGSATVTKGNGPMNVVCKKSGYTTGQSQVDDEFAGATLGNVILGGGIGIFVDAASGAAQEYPEKIVVWMQPVNWKSAQQKAEWQKEKLAYEAEQAKKEKEKKETQKSQNNG